MKYCEYGCRNRVDGTVGVFQISVMLSDGDGHIYKTKPVFEIIIVLCQ